GLYELNVDGVVDAEIEGMLSLENNTSIAIDIVDENGSVIDTVQAPTSHFLQFYTNGPDYFIQMMKMNVTGSLVEDPGNPEADTYGYVDTRGMEAAFADGIFSFAFIPFGLDTPESWGTAAASANWGSAGSWVNGVPGSTEVAALYNTSPGADQQVVVAANASADFVRVSGVDGGSINLMVNSGVTLSATRGVGIDEGGTLMGHGTVAGDVTNNAGSVAPGASVGLLTVDGDFTQNRYGSLEIELASAGTAGTDYDQLVVSGNVFLSGELIVDLTDGFTPDNADTFTILTAAAEASPLFGRFTNMDEEDRVVTLGNEGSFLVTFDIVNGEVVLSDFLAALLAGDFNGDGNVDGQDFSLLKANFGQIGGATLADGDANGDGNVDGQDFSILKANFGASSQAEAAELQAFGNAIVPEPTTLALLGLGGAMLLRRRR
ncbi:MAG: dockerin type I domain-containing protein, partial [Rhodospirillales bacterium]|nr:dockerin type I domain-containing protein [Rhodospirillales bacterium]